MSVSGVLAFKLTHSAIHSRLAFMSRKKHCKGWVDFDWATEGKYKSRVPKAMNQADKVKALVAAGVERVKIQ